MKRRRFVGLASAGAVALSLPVGLVVLPSFEKAVRATIARELAYLRHDPDGITRFVEAYGRRRSQADRLKLQLVHLMGRDSTTSYAIEHVVRAYLSGSDFFRNGMNESRVVVFAALFSSYGGGCMNPFSMVYYPQSAKPSPG